MKKKQAKRIGEVIRDWMSQEPEVHERLLSTEVERIFPELLGPLARHIRSCEVYNRVLFVRLSSASVRHALSLQKSDLIRRINQQINANLIMDISLR
ncbi:hypothetical protein HQ45_05540 [Porphyromonas crevioricanis]|uniref:Zn-ribbon-containing, possibly RNA-binding protein and truncated derivatives n=2 Tax=Porphyromonas crevioricanis TaxID=393921 RepID=A0A0A2FJH0_9PORP|nr:DciA family protein [Porphyromonas crevioricanis]KGN90252.1 hypothetical protein HQ45_05540 [Porphyromonas crevioricanis]KGN96352.1 hypothetical protein HQ38_01805 [Porphyromonas crevioricanis]SJZ95564.1 Protein of unknown function [Porphyromonas crevioricanis]SQH72682.1 Zn-ribbon-containing, possibly RNA-binding protein and truncated derivatives [Porphyromonas crevioricanis]GAD04869.1 hypothetical protein PORCRE_566 [Porphyromonas crevioricanis JCM 15906]